MSLHKAPRRWRKRLSEKDRIDELETQNKRLREEARDRRRIVELEAENRRLLEQAGHHGTRAGVETWIANWSGRLFLFLSILCVVIILVAFYPIAIRYAQNVFNPTQIPQDYQQVSDFVTKSSGAERIAWVPFYKVTSNYSWTNGKRIGPFNIYSYNANLNNIVDVFQKDAYYTWFDNVLSRNPFVDVKLMEENMTVGSDIAAKLLVPLSAKYMVLDKSKPAYRWANPFARDRSLLQVFQTKLLKVYQLKYRPGFIRVAGRTVKADSFFDNLAIARSYAPEAQGNLAFINGAQVLNKRFGVLNINDYKRIANPDPGFEQWNVATGFVYWKSSGAGIQLVADGSTKTEGKGSLKVINGSSANFSLAWITGPSVPTGAGEMISLQTSVKCQNAKWTSVSLEGYYSYTRSWKRLAFCPSIISGTSGWQTYKCSINIPAGITMVRPMLSGGWAADPKKGPGVSWFDDIRISKVDGTFFDELARSGGSAAVTYTKVDAMHYQVRVKDASRPFVLVFGEAYDPLWRASISQGQSIKPVKLYSTINGFPIDRKGSFDLTISYVPQSWFSMGLVISLLTLLFCISVLLYMWKGKELPATESVRKAGKNGAAVLIGAGRSARDYFRRPPGRPKTFARIHFGKRATAVDKAKPENKRVTRSRSLRGKRK